MDSIQDSQLYEVRGIYVGSGLVSELGDEFCVDYNLTKEEAEAQKAEVPDGREYWVVEMRQ